MFRIYVNIRSLYHILRVESRMIIHNSHLVFVFTITIPAERSLNPKPFVQRSRRGGPVERRCCTLPPPWTTWAATVGSRGRYLVLDDLFRCFDILVHPE